jgi:hypothetical protein
MIRAKALGLYAIAPLEQTVLNVAAYLSAVLSNYNYTGRYKGRLR